MHKVWGFLLALTLCFQSAAVGKANNERQEVGWGMQKLNIEAARKAGLTGKGVKIAIIDTGIQKDHPDLLVTGGKSFPNYSDDYQDHHGHGTQIAGIIAAQDNDMGIVGVAPDAEIYALKALEPSGTGSVEHVISAVDWAIANDMDIINMSIGLEGGESASLKKALQRAYSNNILIVAAAGNEGNVEGTGDTVNLPARLESVIAVGAINIYNERLIREKESIISATGPSVEVVAPGDVIYSTTIGSSYNYTAGTSMATAYVSGILALYKQQDPEMTNEQIRSLLHDHALDLGEEGRDPLYGYGLVQAPVPIKDVNKEEISTQVVNQGVIEAAPTNPKEIDVFIDNIKVSFETSPMNVEGRVLVPLRGVFEFLGSSVTWDSNTKTIKAFNAINTIDLKIGSHLATVNHTSIILDVPAQLKNDRTMVPLRFVSEALGTKVNWDPTTKTVTIIEASEIE